MGKQKGTFEFMFRHQKHFKCRIQKVKVIRVNKVQFVAMTKIL